MKKSTSHKLYIYLSVLLIALMTTTVLVEASLILLAATKSRNEFIISLNKYLYFGKWFHDIMENTDKFEYSKSRLYDVKPGALFKFKNLEYDVKMNFNEYRSRVDVDYYTAPNLYSDKKDKIIFLGDSVSMGWGVDHLSTYSAILGKKLNLSSLNFGVSSYNTYRELEKGANSGMLDYSKYIVIQYHVNDADENTNVVKNGPKSYSLNDFNSRMDDVKKTYGDHTGGYNLFDYTIALPIYLYKNIYNSKINTKKIRDLELEARNFFNILKMWPQYNNKKIIVFDGSELPYQDSRFAEVFSNAAKLHGFYNISIININFSFDDYFYYDNHQNNFGHLKIANSLYSNLN